MPNDDTHDETELLQATVRAIKLDRATRQLLTEDQREAVGKTAQAQYDANTPYFKGGSHSDPTDSAARRIAPFRAKFAAIRASRRTAIRAIHNHERLCLAYASGQPAPDTEPRCPGWTVELQTQLGGCGKVLERYRRADGTEQLRSTMLCVGCRKAKQDAERSHESHDQ